MVSNSFSMRSPLAGATEALPAHLPRLYLLNLGEAWAFLKRQKPSFWLIIIYLFFEYVRPQSIYSAIDGLPWSEITIILCLVAVVTEGGPYRKPSIADWLLLAYGAVVIFSSLLAVYPDEAFKKLNFYFDWVVIFWLITNIVNTKEKFLVFMLTYVLWNVKMTQHGVRSWAEGGFGFRDWGTTCAPGWFQNSGECGIQMVMFFPVALFLFIALRPYLGRLKRGIWLAVPLSAVITVLGASTRGGIVGLGALGIWLLMRSKSKYRFKALIYLVVSATAFWLAIPQEAKERFTTMGDDKTSVSRTTYWKAGIQMFEHNPISGIGYYNWLKYYRTNYDAKGELPHNIFVQCGAELGVPGLAVLLALIAATFVMNRRTRKMLLRGGGDPFLYNMSIAFDGALIGYLVTAFFVTVLYYPFFWINLAFTVTTYNIAQTEEAKRLAEEAASRWSASGARGANARSAPAAPAAVAAASGARVRALPAPAARPGYTEPPFPAPSFPPSA